MECCDDAAPSRREKVEVVECRDRVCADLMWDLGMLFLQALKLVHRSRLGRKAMLGTPSEGAQTQKIAPSIGEWCRVQGGVQERVLPSPLLPLFLQTRENQAFGMGKR